MATKTALLKGERTRRGILDASYRLIIRQGFAATSMREIAKRTHLSLGAIYNHFSSKEDIFRAIVEERHPFIQILPLLHSVDGQDVETFVRNAARTLVDQLGHHPDFLNLMLIEIVEFKARHLPLVFGRILPLVEPLVARMSASDGSTRNIPPFVLARAFLGMFFSYYMTEKLLGNAMPSGMAGNAMKHFVDIFLRGILEEQRA